MRKKRPLDRTTAVRDASLIVIASEDTYAVKQYFEKFTSTKIQFRVLETDDGKSAPAHVMARLDEYRKEYEIGEGDEFWFVSDCDHWITAGHIQNLLSVVQQCWQKGIGVALSNPCFELWLLLHFADCPTDELSCDEIAERIRKAAGKYDKTKVYNLPIDNAKVAAAVSRSSENKPDDRKIPVAMKTSIHKIIKEMVLRGIISIDD